jgi:glycosyltransferase involved in cell wall biosynthesis
LNVLVLTTRIPFIRSDAEELRDSLVLNLQTAGVQAESMSLPFTCEPAERLVEEMWIARTIEIANVDRVIALAFPAYLAPHPNKVCWVVHQYRQAYDLFDEGQSNVPTTPRGDTLRRMIRTADNLAFTSAQALFALSPIGQGRIRHYNGLEAQILPRPLSDPGLFVGVEADGYVFAGGSVGRAKRQALLIQALAYAPGVRLVVAGPPDDETTAPALRELAARIGVEDRLTLDLRLLPRAEVATLVNRSSACAYIPLDEESIGCATMEAFQAGKPVVTVDDARGVLEIVHHEHTGLVAEPTPEALGAALASVIAAPTRAVAMGAAGHDLLNDRVLTWPRTIERLLA